MFTEIKKLCIFDCGSIQKQGADITLGNVWQINTKDHVLKWKEVGSLNKKHQLMGGAVFRENLVVLGGYNENGVLISIEFYLAALNKWTFASPLQKHRSGCASAAIEQHLFALGGAIDGECSTSVERINNLSKKWTEIQPTQMQRKEFAAVFCDKALYVIGSQTDLEKNAGTNTVEKYDVGKEKWHFAV